MRLFQTLSGQKMISSNKISSGSFKLNKNFNFFLSEGKKIKIQASIVKKKNNFDINYFFLSISIASKISYN